MTLSWKDWLKRLQKKTNPSHAYLSSHFRDNDIAIIGIACRFPDAENYASYWENLVQEKNSIREISKDRWDIDEFYAPKRNQPNKTNSKWAGLIKEVDKFDASFFQISPREAQAMDPQQRLILEESWHCIEDAGVPLKELQDKVTAVFVGMMATDYFQHTMENAEHIDIFSTLGSYEGLLANRVSYAFNFTGVSQVIDAACASSLVTLHHAKETLQSNKCDYALAGGVSVICHPLKYISFSKGHMLSPDGQCKTFDAAANGYVPGEGVGMLLLTTLANARKQGHHIYGVLKGSSVRHSGQTRSITAPRIRAQRTVIKEALQDSGIPSHLISYVEAHGTGTSLGDPIEIAALTEAFATDKKQFCAIGSVKTNIGHLEAAAGVAGVIKVLMMMQAKTIAKTLNITHINPMIDFDNSPFVPAGQTMPWPLLPATKERFAGVSSFGFGGVNSHVILAEYTNENNNNSIKKLSKSPFVLSAISEESLNALLEKWRQYVISQSFQKEPWENICSTLLTGRQALRYRFGLTIGSKEALVAALHRTDPSKIVDSQSYSRMSAILSLEPFKDFNQETFITFTALYPNLKAMYAEINKEDLDSPMAWQLVSLVTLGKAILQSGFAPQWITGEKIGMLAAYVVSGMLTLSQALKLLANQTGSLTLQRPLLPLFDSEEEKLLTPYEIDDSYLITLMKNIAIKEEDKHLLFGQAEKLFDNQFTFKNFVLDWKPFLESYQLKIEESFQKQNELSAKESTLLAIIFQFSMQQLNRKWDLPNRDFLKDKAANELIELLIAKVINNETMTNLFLAAHIEELLPDIMQQVNANKHLLVDSKNMDILRIKSQYPREIKNAAQFLEKKLQATVSPITAQQWYLRIGGNESALQSFTAKDLSDFLLHTWQKGVRINWSSWYHLSIQKVSLPTYAFAKDTYWLPIINAETIKTK